MPKTVSQKSKTNKKELKTAETRGKHGFVKFVWTSGTLTYEHILFIHKRGGSQIQGGWEVISVRRLSYKYLYKCIFMYVCTHSYACIFILYLFPISYSFIHLHFMQSISFPQPIRCPTHEHLAVGGSRLPVKCK